MTFSSNFLSILGIYDDVGLKPTCVQFVPSSEHHLLVGNEAGELQLYDIRKPKNCIVKNDMTEKAVSKIKFSPSLKNTFGVCSETSSLRVFTLDPTLSSLDIKWVHPFYWILDILTFYFEIADMRIVGIKTLFEIWYGSLRHRSSAFPVVGITKY